MVDRATPEAVMAAYAERINRHDFELLIPLIDDDATFGSALAPIVVWG